MRDTSIEDLISKLTIGESKLAQKCRSEALFYDTTVKYIKTLEVFYRKANTDGDYLESFRRKLRRWIKDPPDSYIGFWGELQVAHWLCQHKTHHYFINETKGKKSPDIAMEIKSRDVFLEIKTMAESEYEWFAERIQKEINNILSNPGIHVKSLVVREDHGNDLINKAVGLIRQSNDEDQCFKAEYEYIGDEGKFSFFLQKDDGFVTSWPESRVRKDGTSWIESQLKTILGDNIGQFQLMAPTFLVWVSFDKLLPSFRSHVDNVIEHFGEDYPDVAGVIILEPFTKWYLSINNYYSDFKDLNQAGIFNAIVDIDNQ